MIRASQPTENEALVRHERRRGWLADRRESLSVPAWPENLLHHVELASRSTSAAFVLHGSLSVRRLSFARCIELARRLADELHARGLRKGDRVLLWGGNSPEWVLAFLACMMRGVVLVPLDDLAGVAFVRRIQSLVGARLAIVSRASEAPAGEALDPALPRLVLEDLPRELARPSAASAPAVDLRSDDLLEILFTSGTTAEPKGVVITHGNVIANLAPMDQGLSRFKRLLPCVPRRSYLSAVPLSHMFGQIAGLFFPLLTGIGAVFVSVPRPGAVAEAMRAESCLGLVAVPRLLRALRNALESELARSGRLAAHLAARERLRAASWWRRALRFRSARARLGWRCLVVVSGGSALPVSEASSWRELGYLVAQGYGMTETAPVISCASPLDEAPGTAGKPLTGLELRISEDDELLVRGPNVTPGYWTREGLVPATDAQGWLHTGDLGSLDEAGRLFIKGRSKDLIVLGSGLNVHASDVEAALDRQEEIRESAVVGRRGAGGESVHAVLLPSPLLRELAPAERDRRLAAAVERANATLADYQRVRSHELWSGEDFPRTLATGKVTKRLLSASLAERPAENEPVVRVLRELLGASAAHRSASSPEALPETASLTSLGLSSLDVAELASRIELEQGIDLSDVLLGSETTVAELRVLTQAPGKGTRRRIAMPRWTRSVPGRAFGALLRALVLGPWLARAFRSLEVQGLEHLEGLDARDGRNRHDGAVILVGNHCSFLDAPTVFRALPWRFVWRLATPIATEPFHPFFTSEGRPFARLLQGLRFWLTAFAFNGFPLPRRGGFRPSLVHAAKLTDLGFSLLIFPEGAMSQDGTLQRFQGGAGLLAKELDLPVLPFALSGLHEILPRGGGWTLRRGRGRIRFGAPLRAQSGESPEELTRRLEASVRALQARA